MVQTLNKGFTFATGDFYITLCMPYSFVYRKKNPANCIRRACLETRLKLGTYCMESLVMNNSNYWSLSILFVCFLFLFFLWGVGGGGGVSM